MNLGRTERVDDQHLRGIVPADDIDALVVELVGDRLDPRAADPHAGADAVDAHVVRRNGHLGSETRLARDRLDLDDFFADLGNLEFEKLDHEIGAGAREENLDLLACLDHVVDQRLDPLARLIVLPADPLLAREDPLGPAEVDDHVAAFDPLHGSVDQLARPVLVLAEDDLTLGLANLLDDDLLGRLGLDAAHVGVFGQIFTLENLDIARESVYPDLYFVLGAVPFLDRRRDGTLDRFEQDLRIDILFLVKDLNQSQEFCAVHRVILAGPTTDLGRLEPTSLTFPRHSGSLERSFWPT